LLLNLLSDGKRDVSRAVPQGWRKARGIEAAGRFPLFRRSTVHPTYLDAIRGFEGFTAKADWDYAQFTNGYGTRAKHAGEVIDKAEADRRFKAEIAEARAVVERHAANASEGTKAALTSLTFNAGDKWIRSGLGDAVRSGDIERVREIFVQYNKAGGEVLPGLARRRLAEAAWIGAPQSHALGSGAGWDAISVAAAGSGVSAEAPVAMKHVGQAPVDMAALAARTAAPSPPPTSREMAVEMAERDRDAVVATAVAGEQADPDTTRIASAVTGFAGEARLTQLLLASKLIGGASSRGDDDGAREQAAI
jgi:lysozyme